MRLLLFSDLHRDVRAAHDLLNRASEYDVLVGAGDFANMHTGLADCLTILKQSPKPLVIVAGNNETQAALARLCQDWTNIHVLHGTGIRLNGIDFFGVGGGIPVTPFGSWSYDFTESQATELLQNCPPQCVLITHSPPKGAVDRNAQGESLGSTSIRECILRTQPLLAVCGHIHASAQKRELLGNTPVINAGPTGIVFEIEHRSEFSK
jgi:Icc-related predicted phosphoesterase